MIVGNGVIAKACADVDHDEVLIFASGVSNSRENRITEYEREKKLFVKTIEGCGLNKLIYFSTSSVIDPSLSESSYVKFKLEMEEYALNAHPNVLILRLPQVLGYSNNQSQLGNFLYDAIENEKVFNLYTNACRYLMLAEDLKVIVSVLIEHGKQNHIYNVAYSNRSKMQEIVQLFELNFMKKAKFNKVDKGECYTIDNADFIQLIDENKQLHLNSKTSQIIEKFVFGKKMIKT